jgi:cAMP-dependent protein kinase regulator
MATQLSKLRTKAQQLIEKGKFKRALPLIEELASLEPGNPHWPKKRGEMLQRLGKTQEAVEAFAEAAEGFARKGFLVKGIGLCKVILNMDPGHLGTKQMLAELYAQKGTSEYVPLPESKPAVLPGRGLDSVNLGKVFPNPAQRQGGTDAEFFEIPLGASLPQELVEADPLDMRELINQLPLTPLFQSLDAAALGRFIEEMELREFAAGQTIVRQGEPGTGLFILMEGEAAVYREAEGGTGRVEVNRMNDGAFFGEISLLTTQERTATVEAASNCLVIEISRSAVASLVNEHPAVLRVMLGFFRERLINTLTSTSPIFAPFAGAERRKLTSRFSFLQAGEGFALQQQGQRTQALFIILCGTVEVQRDRGDGNVEVVGSMGTGDLCGLVSMMRDVESSVTVVTKTRTWLLRLDEEVFRSVILAHPQVRRYVENLTQERVAVEAARLDVPAELTNLDEVDDLDHLYLL